jgi:triosephosphate isomerase
MNGLRASLGEADELLKRVSGAQALAVDIMICPPATLIAAMADKLSSSAIAVGAQDCHAQTSGAHTGDISPEMLADAGASAVIVGHSERRADHGESDDDVNAKAQAVHRAGIVAIICIGETEEERRAGRALEIVTGQLRGSLPAGADAANTIIAYEPVWAIGTGLTPTPTDIAEVHGGIRSELEQILGEGEGAKIRVLYGGSVKGANAAELMAIENVNGALVGGASLKAQDFFEILAVYADG